MDQNLRDQCQELFDFIAKTLRSAATASAQAAGSGGRGLFSRGPVLPDPLQLQLQLEEAIGQLGRLQQIDQDQARHHQDRFRRFQRQQATLVHLATHPAVVSGDLPGLARALSEQVAEALEVARVGIWLLVDNGRQLKCLEQFIKSQNRHESDLALDTADFPQYFQTLRSGRALVSADVQTDPATRELLHPYLHSLGISSMLDAPIRAGGEVAGVVCLEHVGPIRHWVDEEVTFAAAIADLIAQVLVGRDRLQAEKAWRESEQRFSQFMDNIPAAVFIQDSDSSMIYVNAFLKRFFNAESWLGKPPDQFLPPDIAAELLSRQTKVRPDDLVSYRIALPDRDGNIRHFETFRFQIPRVDLPPLAGSIALDITELQQSEEELSRLQNQLVQSQKMEAIGRLAGGIAHDFNNLLSPILGYADLTIMDLEQDSTLRENVQQIKEAAERAASLTRQLLSFTRKQVLDFKPANLNRIISDFSQMLRRLIGEEIELVFQPAAELKEVRVDQAQLQQVLMNLAINAKDAMPEGGILAIETALVTIDDASYPAQPVLTPGEYVMISISDTGQGMDAKTMKHLFEPFFTTKEQGKGTGLGLSTVYGIVLQHDGHVSVQSVPSQGTCFQIFLPPVAGGTVPAPAPSTEPLPSPGKETIMVVEDEATVQKLACDILVNHGYQVVSASSPHDAIMIAQQYPGGVDLLLTAVVMPRMNGKTLFQNLERTRAGLKVLYMSGYSSNIIAEYGLLEEGIHFLQKPFSVQALLQKVREALD